MKAALYIRVSSQEQVLKGYSLDAQRENLTSFAERNNIEVYDLYADEGISARKPYNKRPAFCKMLDDAECGRFDTILVIKLDRFFRNVASYHEVMAKLEKAKVSWKATLEDYDTTTAEGRLKINLFLSIAENEADRTSERIKFVNESKRKQGLAVTGSVPIGYKIKDKHIVIDDEKEQLVRRIFSAFDETGSVQRMREIVQEEFCYPLKFGNASKILSSEAYIGTFYGIPNYIPAYFDEAYFNRIQKLRPKAARCTKERRTYLFSGMVVCGECGGRIAAHTNTYSGYRQYACHRGHRIEKSCCNNATITEQVLERRLIALVDEDMQKAQVKEITQKHTDSQKAAENAKRKISKLKDLYLADMISLEEMKREKARLDSIIIQSTRIQPTNERQWYDLIPKDWKSMYIYMSDEEKRIFWRKLISEITWNKDKTIEIVYT